MMNLRPELKPGTVIEGKFEVLRKLSEGSLGEDLYLGRHRTLSREIIIKILPQRGNVSKEQVERFIQSTKLIASIQHSNILGAYEAGEYNGMYFLVTAYEEGSFLREALKKRNRLDEIEALKIIFELAKALKYAWIKAKVLHRNISPDTILITSDNQAMLTEFDLAKIMTDTVKNMTVTGFTVGNPAYMSPEQVRGRKDLDCRSDIYCLGIVFYEMLCGKPPFTDEVTVKLMEAQLTGKHAPVWQVNPLVSPHCSEIIDKMLKKERESRYAGWDPLISDIRNLIAHEAPDAKASPDKGSEKKNARPRQTFREHGKYSIISNYFLVFMGIVIVSAITVLFAIYYNPEKNIAAANDISNMIETLEHSKKASPPKAETKAPAKPSEQSAHPKETAQDKAKAETEKAWKAVQGLADETLRKNGDYDNAMAKLEAFRKKYNSPNYDKLAAEEMAKLKKAKRSAAENVMKDLREKAQKLADNKEFHKASSLLATYTAAFAGETAGERMKLAREFEDKAVAFAAEKNKLEEKKSELIDEISSMIIKGQYKTAAASFSSYNIKHDEIQKTLDGLNSINKTIMDSFRKQNGKDLRIETIEEGEKDVKVVVKGDFINLEEKMEKAIIQRRLDISQLTCNEKMKHMAELPPETRAVFLAVENLKSKKYRDAEKSLDTAGALKSSLKKQLSLLEEKSKITQE